MPGTSHSSRPDGSADGGFSAVGSLDSGPSLAGLAFVANWYRDNARRSCGTVVIGASSPIDCSWDDGAYRATTAAWSIDTCPAASAVIVVGNASARPASRTTSPARAGERPACSTSQCSGDRIPSPAHRCSSSSRTVSTARSACAWFSRAAIIDTSDSRASISCWCRTTAAGRLIAQSYISSNATASTDQPEFRCRHSPFVA